MSDIVIRAEGLGKKYFIGHQSERERYTALRDVIARSARRILRSAADLARGRPMIAGDEIEEFWALRDVDFEIEDQPEVVSLAGFGHVPAIAAAGETQLGDVRLAPPIALAAGTVVDDLGAPLAGAVVTARPGRMVPRTDAPAGIPKRRPLNQTPIRTRSDGSGAFTLHLPPEARGSPVMIGAFTVDVTLEGYAQQDQAASHEPGRRDVKVVLRGLGTIEGNLLIPAHGIPVRSIRMVVTPAGATPSEPMRFQDCVDSDGRFRLAGIPPGLVTLAITRTGAEPPLASFADVVVLRLAASPDTRLHSIALN